MSQLICPVLAEAIRRARMGAGLTARAAAEKLCVREDHLTAMERGVRPIRLDVLRDIAKLEGIPRELRDRFETAVLYPERAK